MKRYFRLAGIALTITFLIFISTTSNVSAHERRQVGQYAFVVGFLNEPAYAGQANRIDLTICNGNQCNYTVQDGLRVLSNPVKDAEKTLKAEVSQGSAAPLALPLEPRYANPGKYASYFLPSKVGTYIFHVFGTLGGKQIDEKFTSGPNTFGDPEQIRAYPPVTTQTTEATQIQASQNSANMATTLGIIGIILGALGLAAGGLALARRPRGAVVTEPASKPAVENLRG